MECSGCSKIFKTLQQCARCGLGNYCSKECQVSHWIEHKKICVQSTKKTTENKKKTIIESRYCEPATIWKIHPYALLELMNSSMSYKDLCPIVISWKKKGTTFTAIHKIM